MSSDPTDNPKVQAGWLFAVFYLALCFFVPQMLGVLVGLIVFMLPFLIAKHFLDQWNR